MASCALSRHSEPTVVNPSPGPSAGVVAGLATARDRTVRGIGGLAGEPIRGCEVTV